MSTDRVYPSTWARRVYGRLVRLYPRGFRDLYGEEIEADFVDMLQHDAAAPSASARIGGWAIVLRDLAASIPREWLTTLRTRPSAPTPRGPGPHPRPRRRGELMSDLLHDVRYTLRTLRFNRGFSAMVVATLALGIGANVAMFSVVDAVLLSSLPYRDADRLVMVWNRHAGTGADKVQVSGPDFLDYRSQTSSFEDFAYIHNSPDNTLTGGTGGRDGPAEQIDVGYVSTNFFRFLGREPTIGRAFAADDETSDGATPSVISNGLWARRYGSDPDIVGRTIYIAGNAMEVIGVMPADFELVLPYSESGVTGDGATFMVDVWRTLSTRTLPNVPRSMSILRVFARLEPGVPVRQAQEEMDLLARRLQDDYRVHSERRTAIDLMPMHADVVGSVKPIILSLFGAVGFVLLIACANVANLTLVRAANRRREVAVRVALGAPRWRIVRHLLAENTVLALGGAAAGVLLARAIVGGIVGVAPPNVPMLNGVGVDSRVLVFALGITIVAMLLFGVWPALRGTRVAPLMHLNDGPRGGLGRGRGRAHRVRAGIATAEIALSLVLLVGGGLLIRSFLLLQGARLGFEPKSVLTAKVAMPHGAYDDATFRANYWTALRRQVLELPDVEAAGLVWPLPFADQSPDAPYGPTGGESEDWGRYVAVVATASPGYFEAIGATLIDGGGRTFEVADLDRDNAIAIVDEVMARRLYPGESAVGRTVWIQPLGSDEKLAREIVGVIKHIRHNTLAGPEREVLYELATSTRRMVLVVRTGSNPVAALPELRQIAASLDPNMPLFDARTLGEYVRDEIAPTRFTMTLASAFAVVALVMAAVGLYGVISYSVTQRASELGVRVALGAHDGAILRLVLRQGATMAGLGIAIGLIASFGLTRIIRSLLVGGGVAPTDAPTLVGVSLLLAGVTMVASYFPARRAARLDPVVALRKE